MVRTDICRALLCRIHRNLLCSAIMVYLMGQSAVQTCVAEGFLARSVWLGVVGLKRTWDQKLSSGSLLTFMSTHLFQFRFAETEQHWLFSLTFFRTCERLARARNSDTISTSPSYPAVTLSTQCLARQWIHVLLISLVSSSNCPHFLRVGGLGHELDSRRFRSVHSEPSVSNCARAVCTQKSGHISLSSAGSLVPNADGNRFANALGRRSRATGETNCKYVVDVSIPQVTVQPQPFVVLKISSQTESCSVLLNRFLAVPVPRMTEQFVEVPKTVSQDRMQQRTLEQISVTTVPQVVEELVEVFTVEVRSYFSEQTY